MASITLTVPDAIVPTIIDAIQDVNPARYTANAAGIKKFIEDSVRTAVKDFRSRQPLTDAETWGDIAEP